MTDHYNFSLQGKSVHMQEWACVFCQRGCAMALMNVGMTRTKH